MAIRKLHVDSTQAQQPVSRKLTAVLFKRVWLPDFIYQSMPLFYMACGMIALAAALFMPGQTWLLPWLIVFGIALIHLGLGILNLRYRFQKKRQIPDAPSRS